MQTTLESPAIKQENQKQVSFGDGRYSPLMAESFKDAKNIFGLDDAKAEKLARQIGSDFGAAMRGVQVDARIGKSITKDGKVTLAEAAKLKGVTLTNALAALRALDFANGAVKAGFNRNATKWCVSDTLAEYFASL